MKHEKTFEAINKLRDVESELHRLKNALELANKGLESERTWVGLTDEEQIKLVQKHIDSPVALLFEVEAKLKEKNT